MSSRITLLTSRFSFSKILFYSNHRARLSDGPFPGSVAAPLESLQIAFSHGFPAFCQKSCSSRAFCLVSSCWLFCRSRTERLFPETATAALESRSRGEPGMEELGKAWPQSCPTWLAFCSSQHSFSIIALVKSQLKVICWINLHSHRAFKCHAAVPWTLIAGSPTRFSMPTSQARKTIMQNSTRDVFLISGKIPQNKCFEALKKLTI